MCYVLIWVHYTVYYWMRFARIASFSLTKETVFSANLSASDVIDLKEWCTTYINFKPTDKHLDPLESTPRQQVHAPSATLDAAIRTTGSTEKRKTWQCSPRAWPMPIEICLISGSFCIVFAQYSIIYIYVWTKNLLYMKNTSSTEDALLQATNAEVSREDRWLSQRESHPAPAHWPLALSDLWHGF